MSAIGLRLPVMGISEDSNKGAFIKRSSKWETLPNGIFKDLGDDVRAEERVKGSDVVDGELRDVGRARDANKKFASNGGLSKTRGLERLVVVIDRGSKKKHVIVDAKYATDVGSVDESVKEPKVKCAAEDKSVVDGDTVEGDIGGVVETKPIAESDFTGDVEFETTSFIKIREYESLAEAADSRNDYEEAIKFYELAGKIAVAGENYEEVMLIYEKAAYVATSIVRTAEFMESTEKIIKFYRMIGNFSIIAGDAAMNIGEEPKAINFYEDAAIARKAAGEALVFSKDFHRAIILYELAGDAGRAAGDAAIEAGEIARAASLYEDAIIFYRRVMVVGKIVEKTAFADESFIKVLSYRSLVREATIRVQDVLLALSKIKDTRAGSESVSAEELSAFESTWF